MSEKKEIIVADVSGNLPAVEITPMTIIDKLVTSGANLDQIEKFMELQERNDANEARKAFVAAMAAFKADPPKISKDKTVAYGNTKYSHASLANVTNNINSGLGEHGLSAGWKTDQDGKEIKVTCTITHNMGHSESTSLTAGADNSGQKNAIQAIGSTVSYLQRYTLLALTGLASHDMDDDGKGSEPIEYIGVDHITALTDLIEETKSDVKQFLKYLKVESLEKMPLKSYNVAIKALEVKKAK